MNSVRQRELQKKPSSSSLDEISMFGIRTEISLPRRRAGDRVVGQFD